MEFITKEIKPIANTTPVVEDKITLSSTASSISTMSNTIKLDVSKKDSSTYFITHDSTELVNSFDKDTLKKTLTSVQGINGKVHTSSKSIEGFAVSVSEFPLLLSYSLITDDGLEKEYKVSYSIPQIETTTLLSPTAEIFKPTQEVSVKDAVVNLDQELQKTKAIINNYNQIYSKDENKIVSLHSIILKLSDKIDKLTLDLEDVKTKTKAL